MPDYQKLFSRLYNEITKTIENLENIQEEVFNEFVESNPLREDARTFMADIDFKSNSHYKLK